MSRFGFDLRKSNLYRYDRRPSQCFEKQSEWFEKAKNSVGARLILFDSIFLMIHIFVAQKVGHPGTQPLTF
jgi:hypothetical protein